MMHCVFSLEPSPELNSFRCSSSEKHRHEPWHGPGPGCIAFSKLPGPDQRRCTMMYYCVFSLEPLPDQNSFRCSSSEKHRNELWFGPGCIVFSRVPGPGHCSCTKLYFVFSLEPCPDQNSRRCSLDKGETVAGTVKLPSWITQEPS
jgi:hypothetical protein